MRLIGAEDPAGARISDGLGERLASLLAVDDVTRATVRFVPPARGGGGSLLLECAGEGWERILRYDLDAEGRIVGDPK